ncbi:MAG TPA: hypothetical protein PK344_14845 [Syntrophorhabdaceae bacterium]|jgi:transcriptional regulator with XRE-family HTH domain|nr:hypothetical protein [Syntrophorhabdaceae bacterium]
MNNQDEFDPQALSLRIRTIIKTVGSAEKFANAAGISCGVLKNYTSCQADPTRKKLIAMANAGGVSVGWLATGKASQEPMPTNRQLLILDGAKKAQLISDLFVAVVEGEKDLNGVIREIQTIAELLAPSPS